MRILLSTLGTSGDVLPFAALGGALAAAGHEVTAHAWAMYRDHLAVPGVRFVASGATVNRADLDAAATRAIVARTPLEQVQTFAQLFYFEHLDAARASIRAAMAHADLAVINVIDHVAQAAAIDAGIPWVIWASRPPSIPAAERAEAAVLGPVDAELSERLGHELRVFRTASPHGNLVAASPALAGTAPPPFRVTGAWRPPAQRVEPAVVDRIRAFVAADARPAVFVTFGTLPDPHGRAAFLVESARRAQVRLVIQSAGTSTSDTLFVSDWLAYDAILDGFAGAVHHGGSATTHEMCRAGLPAFCVPHFGDQYFWGPVLAARGLGPRMLPHIQLGTALAERLRALVEDPRYRARAAEIATAIATEDGVADAVDYLATGIAARQ